MDETKPGQSSVALNPRGIMPVVGILCVIAGLIWGVWAYQIRTSVYVPSGKVLSTEEILKRVQIDPGREVESIGLIAAQQKNLICAGVVTISGILLFGFGTLIENLPKANKVSES